MKLSINKKIMIGFGLIIILMIIANVYVLYQLIFISDTAKITLTSEVRAIDITKRLQSLLYGEERNAQKYWIANDKTYYVLFAEGTRSIDESLDSLSVTQSDNTGKMLIGKIRRIHNWYVSQVTPPDQPKQIVKSAMKGSVDQQRSDSLEVLHTALSGLIKHNQVSIDNAMTNVEKITNRSSGVSIFLAICTLIGSIALAFIIPRTITRPIKVLIRGTEQIARGTFEPIKVTSRDEIAQLTEAVNDMSDQLKKKRRI
jgi:CHASE3 domain sensor protein